MIRLITLSLITLSTLAPLTVQAETVVRFDETVSVSDSEQILNDFYVLASKATMSGSVAGDMYVAGGSVTINGPIEADFTAFSGRSTLSASVTDDVRLVTGEAIISGPVGGDVFVVGGTLQILSTASVAGDVYMFGGEADIAGPVAGSVLGTYGSLRVDTVVGGDVDVRADRLTLGAQAEVTGDVRYASNESLVRAPEASVSGSVIAESTTHDAAETTDARTTLIPFLILLFSVLVVYLVAKRGLAGVAQHALAHPARAGLLGLCLLILLPITSILLLVTSLGALLGVIVLATWFIGAIAGYIITPAIVGLWLAQLFKQPAITLLGVIAGTALFYGLSLVPVVNGFVIFFGLCIGFGALAEYFYRIIRQ